MSQGQEEWAKALRALMHQDGGSLPNGWTLEVKFRSTGGRDIKIRDTEGHKYRSICQAAAALAGGPKKSRKTQAKKGSIDAGTAGQKAKGNANSEGPKRKRKRQGQTEVVRADIAAAADSRREKEHPVFGKLLRQARLHISRIRREMDILEVYDAEGWRGSNKDKLKPRAEMQRAEHQMSVSREAVRGIIRQCEAGEGTPIPSEDYDSDGGIDQLKMFCAICKSSESTDENDIVLCDGPCRRAFHERCCTPAFVSAELEDESDWLCPACYTKDEILDLLNEEFETSYELETPADRLLIEDIFGRGGRLVSIAAQAGGTWASLLGGADLVSSDTDDDSYRGSLQNGGAPREADCEGAHLSRSPSRLSSTSAVSSSTGSSEEEKEEVVEGKRRRTRVDYVAMNSQIFGEEEEDENDRDYG